MTTARPIAIALACDTFWPDVNGASYFTYRLARVLSSLGHDVGVICPSDSGRNSVIDLEGVTVLRVRSIVTPFHPTFRIAVPGGLANRAHDFLAAFHPHVLHIQSQFTVSRATAKAASRRRIPIVATNHFMPENLVHLLPVGAKSRAALSRLAWRDCARVFRQAQIITAPTARAADLMRANGFDREVVPISCGVDLDTFGPDATGNELIRSKYSLPAGPLALYVGRIEPEKSLDELVLALKCLRRDRALTLVMVGSGSRERHVVELARRSGVDDRLRMLGHVPDADVPGLLNVATVFCMPGRAELQSIATLEAMACGLPVVAADAMALPHLVEPGVNGFLYTPGDHIDLARRLLEIVTDPAQRRSMSEQSLRRAKAHGIGQIADAFLDTYADAARQLDAMGSVRPCS